MDIMKSIEAVQSDEDILFIDVRQEAAYESGHLPGAVHLNLNQGEAFLLEEKQFEKEMQTLGVTYEKPIVLYDKGNFRAAAKAWYTFYHYGHDAIYILDGGFKAWESAQQEISTKIEKPKPSNYQVEQIRHLDATIEDVKEKVQKTHQSVLVDSRAHERYAGIVEPKYHQAGHIPDAVNYEASQVVDSSGSLKDQDALRKNFEGLDKSDQVIVSCGSGNSAAVNFVALKAAGYKNVSLYAGGFSEWIEDENNEVEK